MTWCWGSPQHLLYYFSWRQSLSTLAFLKAQNMARPRLLAGYLYRQKRLRKTQSVAVLIGGLAPRANRCCKTDPLNLVCLPRFSHFERSVALPAPESLIADCRLFSPAFTCMRGGACAVGCWTMVPGGTCHDDSRAIASRPYMGLPIVLPSRRSCFYGIYGDGRLAGEGLHARDVRYFRRWWSLQSLPSLLLANQRNLPNFSESISLIGVWRNLTRLCFGPTNMCCVWLVRVSKRGSPVAFTSLLAGAPVFSASKMSQ